MRSAPNEVSDSYLLLLLLGRIATKFNRTNSGPSLHHDSVADPSAITYATSLSG